MSPEAQRIAIAEACGWKQNKKQYIEGVSQLFWKSPSGQKRKQVPDYLNDLNAMHEAEKILTSEQGWFYAQNLVVDGGKGWFASASERAEAFLKTIGKWQETSSVSATH